MREIGIRELKQQASDIVRRVREDKETIIITNRGKAVAKLVPVESLEDKRSEAMAVLAEMKELAQEIGRKWPPDVSAAEAVKEQRREQLERGSTAVSAFTPATALEPSA